MPKANTKVSQAAASKLKSSKDETPDPWVTESNPPTKDEDAPPAAEEKKSTPKAKKNQEVPDPKPAGLGTFVSLDEQTEKTNALLYGREGSGKTTAAAHAANRGRVLVINAEGGLKATALRGQGVNTKNIVVWPEKGASQINHSSLSAIHAQLAKDLEEDPDSWFCVVVDSLTEIAAALTDVVSTHRVDKSRMRGVDIDSMEEWNTDRNDFGIVTKQLRDFTRKMRDLPCHFVFTALERRDVDEDTGVTAYGPSVPPAIQKDVLGYMDLVFYLKPEDEEKPFRALTRSAGKYRAKDRFNVFPRVLEEPSFDRIVDYVNGDLKREEESAVEEPPAD